MSSLDEHASAQQGDPRVSVVIAVFNEAESISAVCAEVLAQLRPVAPFEIVFVDDGSTDETTAILQQIAELNPCVRLVRHAHRCGKSQAIRTGVLAARAPWIATLDGDGQNDPADLPDMLRLAWGANGRPPLVAGIRVRRDDAPSRLIATRIANGLRSALLDDDCPDTGCGVKVFPREAFLLLPCFEGMHRFLPALFQRYGHPLVNHPVRHRARAAGRSKYTNWGRALVGLFDMAGVIWLTRRTRAPGAPLPFAARPRHLGLAHYLLLFAFALAALAPGISSVPPTDRDESRYAVASTQMLTSGDFVDIRFMDEPRYLQPAGIYWLQSAAVALTSSPGAHEIGAYRLPSLFGALAAVLLTGWLAGSLFGRNAGLVAGALLAASIAVGVEARIAKTDAMLLASITLAQIALMRIYLQPLGHWWRPAVFWSALGAGMMLKGPIILLFCSATVIALLVWDRRVGWLKGLRALWGLPLMLAIVLPWYIAIGVHSDWAFYVRAVGDNLLGKVGESQQSHKGPPGYYLAAFSLTFWPGALFAVLAIPYAWRHRGEPAVRFLIAWIVPAWIVFEFIATKLTHYVLPTYPAIACLAAAALFAERIIVPTWIKALGIVYAGLWLIVSALVAALVPVARWQLDHEYATLVLVAGACVFVLSVAALWLLLNGQRARAAAFAAAAGLIAVSNAFVGGLAQLDSLWLSPRIVEAARAARACPDGKLVSSAYREPSLVFLNGPGSTLLADSPAQAAELLEQQGACALAVIDHDEQQAFLSAGRARGIAVRAAGLVEGVNYSDGENYQLTLFALAPRTRMQ